MDEHDLIDQLIDQLNDGVPDVTFERDVLETDRPDDWGAVELTGEDDSEWADGTMTDQVLAVDVWVCISGKGSRIKRKVQAVLKSFCEEYDGGWKLISRNYIYDLDKVVWRWRVSMWAPLEEDEEEDPQDPETDQGTDPEAGDG